MTAFPPWGNGCFRAVLRRRQCRENPGISGRDGGFYVIACLSDFPLKNSTHSATISLGFWLSAYYAQQVQMVRNT